MWANVWNRVVLLAAGMLLGWNLVLYWAAAEERRREYLFRMILGGVLGLILLIALATTNADAAVFGLVVILFCALIAYAGNARQLLKRPWKAPQEAPERPEAWADGHTICLIGMWEPERYTGSAVWAEFARQRLALGQPTPHWMAFPRWCSRIRRAYATMDGSSPTILALQQVADELQALLGDEVHVCLGSTLELDALTKALRRAVSDGQQQHILVPLSLPDHLATDLRRAVTESRVREAGAVIRYATGIDVTSWLGDSSARLESLWQGQPLSIPPAPDPAIIGDIAATITDVGAVATAP